MDHQPKRLLEKLLEAAIIFAISCYLIRLAICYLEQVWPALVIIATLVVIGIVVYRIWKKNHDGTW